MHFLHIYIYNIIRNIKYLYIQLTGGKWSSRSLLNNLQFSNVVLLNKSVLIWTVNGMAIHWLSMWSITHMLIISIIINVIII